MHPVSLVGAGPGDPELITLRGAQRLADADLVLYDALVSRETLDLASGAQRFFVGKRAGRRGMEQETINRLMIRAARRGRRVVRLKCGDPFVLGRGGEEALALAAAGVPFEIVPGVTSAVAAPALAAVPVTHRGVSAAVLIVSGHDGGAWHAVDSLDPGAATIVVLMGIGTRAALAERLAARGWRRETPAAIVSGAWTPEAAVWMGTLAELAAAPIPLDPPGTIVVGDVVAVGARIAALAGESEAQADATRGDGHACRG